MGYSLVEQHWPSKGTFPWRISLIEALIELPKRCGYAVGAGEMNRTPDLLITNELLYQLSYTGKTADYKW